MIGLFYQGLSHASMPCPKASSKTGIVTSDGRSLRYELILVPVLYEEYENPKLKKRDYIGWDVGPSICLVKEIKFKLDGETYNFPSRSFDDLCRMTIKNEYIKVEGSNKLIQIYARGADGGQSYQVRYTLKSSPFLKLLKREIILYGILNFEKGKPDIVNIYE